jgi:hypothetical protein
MTATHVDLIERSVHRAHMWINDVAAMFGTNDR